MVLTFWESLIYGTVLSTSLMLVLWTVHLAVRDAGLVDLGWAACIAILSIGYAIYSPGASPQRWLAALTGGVWGGRLALHLFVDRIAAEGEDGRYRYLRDHWGSRASLHFLWFFIAQAVLAVGFSLPFLMLSQHQVAGFASVQIAGALLVILAMVGEAIADRQLARFRSSEQNRGRTCRHGLWRYSRHPNYFFEWLVWCGVALAVWPAPFGPWALLAPLAMFVFVTRLTGIPYTEAQALRSRGDDYRAYQLETNAFFPGPWRRGANG
jgi:steroid 5-alpha reductase family enzyme